ncbi:MAG: lipid-A-disaccharide synthase [Chitinophagaceae bacterium]|nr:lipid-A-disaccharide synthase [Chitinophagaceae bacterium]MCW5913922.1 lipid-A-disaccharide synthase [Chitinophagaceae bacterium]MCZ2397967.1 lipid-A-disaccharide synthase [Chitinophagales bacterium]
MKYYLIAGEASGDLHGSNLIKALRQKDPAADIRCWGGDKMQEAGGTIVKHIKALAFMGFIEVVRNLRTILRNIKFCKEDILAFRPDVIVFIDYPGFNMRIAKWAKQQGCRTVYYISPQLWAWKEGRVHQIKKYIDRMLVIFPFEKDFYKKWNYEVTYVGHPLVPVVDAFMAAHPELHPQSEVVALLPGSRKQEIKAKLPIMLEATKEFPTHRFFIGKAPTIDKELYDTYLQGYPNVALVSETYPLLMEASAALVTSGTATLETALFNVPEIVCYRAGRLSYEIGKRLIKLKFICIVNLIMNKEVVKELIQDDLNIRNITAELNLLLHNEDKRKQIMADYQELRALLNYHGNASQNAAEAIIDFLAK